MIKHVVLKALLLCMVIVALVGCSVFPASSRNLAKINLSDLLISAQDLPSGWSLDGYTSPAGDADYLGDRDSISVAFHSDLYPDQNSPYHIGESIYRASGFLAISGAQHDFNYFVNGYQYGSAPPDWEFKSKFADQTFFNCDNPPINPDPVCHWIARYDSVVIFVVAWLIPDRMTLSELATVIGKIDMKAGKIILGK